jgi:hypothetical protein
MLLQTISYLTYLADAFCFLTQLKSYKSQHRIHQAVNISAKALWSDEGRRRKRVRKRFNDEAGSYDRM